MPKIKLRSEQQIKPHRPGAFRAEYDGRCANCPTEISKGDYVGFNAHRRVICNDCCDIAPLGGNWGTIGNKEKDFEDELIIPERLVMPRGRTAADRCNRCFLIHSSAQVDCE